MSARLKALSRIATARLSRRIAIWVFFSIIVIEIIILIPSVLRRKGEVLAQLEETSSTAVSVAMRLLPADASPADVLEQIIQLEPNSLLLGGTLYRANGQQVGSFGEAPVLTLPQAKTVNAHYDGAYYDVVWLSSELGRDYILILRHDAAFVREELYAYIGRIAGLVAIISLFVTLATMIALEPTAITPILQLRADLIRAGEAAGREEEIPQFYSSSIRRRNELGEVIAAFHQMFAQIHQAIVERKRAEGALKQLNEDLESRVKERTAQLAQANEEIQALNARLKAENERLTEVDRIKTDFISTVSHELRTPLTSVLGFAKLIQKKLSDTIFPAVQSDEKKTTRAIKQVGNNISIIVSEGERLTALINDVLDIAKMEAGKVEWKMEPLQIQDILERAIAATSALFQPKTLDLVKDIESELPEFVGDRDRLIQVVINLLSNAIKFTEQGSITCRARKEKNRIVVSIVDTGIGIAPADCPKVFERFKQLGDTLTDKPKGTGLGLPICKQIVLHHGGDIWVKSEMGKGSTFAFTLPTRVDEHPPIPTINIDTLLQQLQNQTIPPSALPAQVQKSILVVDDDANIRELLRQELEAQGYAIQEAQDGLEAINQVKQARPDLIIMDVMMPHMNGFDAAAVLRNDPETMDIPIIVLSIVEDRDRGYRLGVDRYLSKPINTEVLLGDIGALLSQGSSKRHVLVVDEDVSTVKILAEVLKARGYNVAEAFNGEEFKEKAMSVRPDLIIANADFWQHSDVVKTLRFEKDLENVLFILLADEKNNASN